MTRRIIILVTGSRVLVDTAFQEDVQRALDVHIALRLGGVTIVCGDAAGPDEWADELACALGIVRRIYALDGAVYSSASAAREKSESALVRRWDHGLEEHRGTRRWPLVRNRQMVRDCKRERMKGAIVEALGFRALWSKTQGTAYTMNLAREAGFRCVETLFSGGAS